MMIIIIETPSTRSKTFLIQSSPIENSVLIIGDIDCSGVFNRPPHKNVRPSGRCDTFYSESELELLSFCKLIISITCRIKTTMTGKLGLSTDWYACLFFFSSFLILNDEVTGQYSWNQIIIFLTHKHKSHTWNWNN